MFLHKGVILKYSIFTCLCVLLLIFAVFQSAGQAAPKPKLYISMTDLSSEINHILKKNKVDIVVLVTQGYIDPKRTNRVDEKKLREGIRKLFPDSTATGIGVLDWEYEAFDMLRLGNNSDSKFIAVLNEFIKAIKIAKSIRPKIRWGFYEIPLMTNKENYKNIERLLKECDVFFPSFYQYYPSSLHLNNTYNVKNNLKFILQLGKQFHKPVMGFVWHRWFIQNHDKKELIPISITQFSEHVKLLSTFSYQDKKLDGIIWWGADQYFYRNQALSNKEVNQLKKEFKTFEDYHSDLIKKYFNSIYKYFK